MRALPLAALLFRFAAPAAAEEPVCGVMCWRDRVVVFRQLSHAETLVADAALQARLKAENEAAFQEAFEEALGHIDLKQTLAKRTMHGDKAYSGDLRSRMFGRPGCGLCDDPAGISRWAGANRVSADADTLAAAFWDWRTLDEAQRACLGRRIAAADWHEARASRRRTLLRECAEADLAAGAPGAPFPRDRAAFDAQLSALKRTATIMFPHEFEVGARRIHAAERLLKARERAEKSASQGLPSAKAALAAADAADPEAAAAALKDYYEGDGPAGGEYGGPAETPEEAKRWRVLAEALGPALLDATRGSWAGDEIAAFYAKTPLRLEIRATEKAWAMYDPRGGRIILGRAGVEGLLRGARPGAAAADAAVVRRLAVALSPVFVHEATHHRYSEWQRSNDLKAFPSVENEIEAMETEALFVLEKFKRDKAFAREYRAAAGMGRIIQDDNVATETVRAAMSFRDDPEGFRRYVRNDMYAYRAGHEGVAADDHQLFRGMAESYEAEVRHRAGLPTERQAELARISRPDWLDKTDRWPDEAAMAALGTPSLRELAARARAKATDVEARYAAHSARSRAVFALHDERLALLSSSSLPPRPRAAAPPSPGGAP